MNNLPVLTAIVPCKNHEKWIIGCLRSISSQKYPNMRFIFVDDGSTDNSSQVVLESCKDIHIFDTNGKEPSQLARGIFDGYPIILAKFKNSYGPSIARNYAIESSINDTDIYCFLDSDDEYLPGKIDKSLVYFLDDKNVGVVYSDYITENIHNNQQQYQFKEPYSVNRLQYECLPNMDSLIRADCFKTCGLFDNSLRCAEDLDRWLAFSQQYLICHIPEALIKIRVGMHSSSATVDKQTWEECVFKVRNKQR